MKCDVCGDESREVYVASSSLGAISFGYCDICLQIGAEPSGYDEIADKNTYVFYDKESDTYINDNRVFIVPFKDGTFAKTRTEVIQRLKN